MNCAPMAACLALWAACVLAAPPEQSTANARVLRVCADPNNLPYSNDRYEGFENRLAEVVARDLNARIEYTWWAQRRGFVRNTLQAGACDLVMGVPVGYELARTTHPYYRSGFVFVTRADRGLALASLDDPQLRSLRIGVHVIGPEQTPPPAQALAQRGIIDNVVGYSIYGDYRDANPPLRLIDAVVRGDIDVAIAWGPFAGFGAQQHKGELRIDPLPESDALPMRFSIAMGVRKSDAALAAELNRVLEARTPEIRSLLQRYGVPIVAETERVQ